MRLMKLDTTDSISFFQAYLFKVANNLAIDRLRHLARADAYRASMPADAPERGASAEEEAAAAEKIERIRRYASELPPKCRKAFLLRKFHSLSVPDIARQLDLSEQTVGTYLRQALKHCRQRRRPPSRNLATLLRRNPMMLFPQTGLSLPGSYQARQPNGQHTPERAHQMHRSPDRIDNRPTGRPKAKRWDALRPHEDAAYPTYSMSDETSSVRASFAWPQSASSWACIYALRKRSTNRVLTRRFSGSLLFKRERRASTAFCVGRMSGCCSLN